jgi:acyl carrier protein
MPDDAVILAAIQRAIERELGVTSAKITLQTVAADIGGWDSMAHARIVTNVEEALGLTIDMDKAFEVSNVGDLVAVIAGRA